MTGKTIIKAEYVWIDGAGGPRSKTRMIYIDEEPFNDTNRYNNLNFYPIWNYDGSSTMQAAGDDSEVLLNPVAVWSDPFETESNIISRLVLCETMYPDGTYPETSTRHKAVEIFNKKLSAKPWYGIEQEFYIFTKNNLDAYVEMHDDAKQDRCLGRYNGKLEQQGRYYCGVGGTNVFGRQIVINAFNKCIQMGLNVSGMNAEVGPGQWEIQVGPCEGIAAGDELTMLRYVLTRVSEKYLVEVNFEPKPLVGDWNGSGCHTNYSTVDMREGRTLTSDEQAVADYKGTGRSSASGYECIMEAIGKLSEKHEDHMKVYGDNNHLRMTGLHETANYDVFKYGVADRSASIRIPRSVQKDQKGYLEDRRPGSNIDPYVVTSKIFETTVLQ